MGNVSFPDNQFARGPRRANQRGAVGVSTPSDDDRETDCLFLDYDGCLHPGDVRVHSTEPKIRLHAEGHELFESALHLEALLAPYSAIKIVLSTSWIQTFGFDITKNQLPGSLQERVIGATFDARDPIAWRFSRLSRYDQIMLWVSRRPPVRWLALDDDALGWPSKELDRLVLVPPRLGLASESAREDLKARLAAQFGM
jgi:hypothetical protein